MEGANDIFPPGLARPCLFSFFTHSTIYHLKLKSLFHHKSRSFKRLDAAERNGASSIDEVISRSQGGAGVAPPASPGLLTINDLDARRSSNADGSESAASSSRSRPESPRTAGAAPALPAYSTVAQDIHSLLETHIASANKLIYINISTLNFFM